MAQETKKDKPAEAVEKQTKAQAQTAGTESEAGNAQEKPAPNQKAAVQTVQENKKDQASEGVSAPNAPGLKAVSTFISEKRLATWQSAALLRAQGWADDKMVDETEFNKALASTLNRTQGGNNGRRN